MKCYNCGKDCEQIEGKRKIVVQLPDENSSTSKLRDEKVKKSKEIRDSKVENDNIQGKNLGIKRSKK